MADIASGDVTYTVQGRERRHGSRYSATFKLAFGDGALTYPALGIPLDKAKLGCPNVIEALRIVDNSDGDGLLWKYDYENNKLRPWLGKAQTHSHDLKITKGAITAGTEVGLSADAASATLNNNTIAATLTLAKATNGIQSETLAAGAGTELGNVALAATVIYVEVLGW